MRLPGFREDVLSLMKSADLFVMSSVTEGLGSAVLDAMAMGLAVVGDPRWRHSRGGGTRRDRAAGAPASRPLAQAIVRLLKDSQLRSQYGDAGRARVEAHFGVDHIVEATLAVYKSLLPR